MKIRSGFVSNSSSSSFIVEVYQDIFSVGKKKKRLTPEQEKKLKKFGFKLTIDVCPDVYECDDPYDRNAWKKLLNELEKFGGEIEAKAHNKPVPSHEDLMKKKYGYYNYGYYVDCNQDDVIEFLLKNRIPFVASIHYRHYVMIYNGGDYFYTIPNLGNMIDKRGDIEKNFVDTMENEKLLDKQLVEVYLHRNSRLSSAQLLRKMVGKTSKARKSKGKKKK